jgi:hypothetical protein
VPDGPLHIAQRSVLAALAAGLSGTFAIMREIAGVVLGTAAAMAVLATLPACLRGTLAIVRKVAGAVLPAKLSGARRALAILGKIARIPGMSLVGHRMSPCSARTGIARHRLNGVRWHGLSSRLL